MNNANTHTDPETLAAHGTAMPPLADTALAERRLALAFWRAERGQPDDAQRLFQEALSLDPGNVAFRMAYVAFLARQKNWDVTKQELDRAIADGAAASVEWLKHERAGAPDDAALLYAQALLLAQLGKPDEARAAFQQLLAVEPNHGQAMADQAALLDTLGEPDAAALCYQKALAIDQDNVAWLAAYGEFLQRRGRDREALTVLEHALQHNPEDITLQEHIQVLRSYASREADARKRAALAKLKLEEQDSVDEAAALVAEALQIYPNCDLAHRVQAAILVRQGQLIQAEVHLERAIALRPGSAEYEAALQSLRAEIEPQRQHAQALTAQARATTDREVARTLLDQALGLMPNDVEAHVAYAELIGADQPDDAEQHLRAALATAPQHLEANRQYAALLRKQQGRALEAERHLLAALAVQPDDEGLIDDYVGLLIEQGRHQNAINRLQSILGTRPLSMRLQGRLAVAWARMGRLDEALPRFEEALQAEPQDAALRREYAIALRLAGQPALAEDHLRTILKLNPNDAPAHCEYAVLLTKWQRYHEAQQHIEQALALHPDDAQIQAQADDLADRLRQFEKVEEELAYALWLSQQASPARVVEANEAFGRALALDPNSATILKEYGLFLERRGDLVRARDFLGRARKITPGDPQVEKHYAAIPESTLPPQPPVASEPSRSHKELSTPEPPATAPPQPFIKRWWRRLFGGYSD